MFSTDEHVRMLAALRTDLNRAQAQLAGQNAELAMQRLDDALGYLRKANIELNAVVGILNTHATITKP